MKTHLERQLQSSWGTKELAQSRAKREASSAPLKEELEIYEQALKKAIKNIQNSKVLILGPTPELRDLALKYGCEVLSVDISLNILYEMTKVIKHQNHPKDILLRCDWLKMNKYLKSNLFDAALGDASFDNITIEGQKILFRELHQLLKKGGYLITRRIIYLPKKKLDIKTILKNYKQGKSNWLFAFWEYGIFGPKKNKLYNPETKKYLGGKSAHVFLKDMKKESPSFWLTKEDIEKVKNIIFHGRKIVHYVVTEKEWQKMASKYFSIEKAVHCKKWLFSDFAPIYLMKSKKL